MEHRHKLFFNTKIHLKDTGILATSGHVRGVLKKKKPQSKSITIIYFGPFAVTNAIEIKHK